jgi:hypothetical protein
LCVTEFNLSVAINVQNAVAPDFRLATANSGFFGVINSNAKSEIDNQKSIKRDYATATRYTG